jgi:hypothetical protein
MINKPVISLFIKKAILANKEIVSFSSKTIFMKCITVAFCLVALITSCNNEKPIHEENKEAPMDAAAMEKAMKDFSSPGPMHQWLASFNGEWDAEIISFMDPTKPDTSKAVQTYSMILNGLYQEAKITGNMMGMPFEGRSLNGYDNAKKRFVSTWVDNISSGTTYMNGNYDTASTTLNLKGTQTNPSNGRNMNIREVMKIIDADTYRLEMYGDGPDGKEIKFMEGLFKRKK